MPGRVQIKPASGCRFNRSFNSRSSWTSRALVVNASAASSRIRSAMVISPGTATPSHERWSCWL